VWRGMVAGGVREGMCARRDHTMVWWITREDTNAEHGLGESTKKAVGSTDGRWDHGPYYHYNRFGNPVHKSVAKNTFVTRILKHNLSFDSTIFFLPLIETQKFLWRDTWTQLEIYDEGKINSLLS
jgi:hypothetical protein